MNRFTLNLVVFVLLQTIVSFAAPLDVLTVSPTGKVREAKQIVVEFSEPMVPLGTSETQAPPVTLIPQPEGQWRWVDTKTLAFEPPVRMPQATLYTVRIPAGTKSLAGNSLDTTISQRFETPGPTLLHPTPGGRMKGDDPGGSKILPLHFDQPIDAQEVAEKVRLIGGGREYRMVVTPPIRDWYDAATTAHLKPSEPLSPSTQFKLLLEAGLRSKEGPLTGREQSVTFTTAPALEFKIDRANVNEVTVDPSNDFDRHCFDPSAVTVSPKVPDLKVEAWGDYGYLRLFGSFTEGKTYDVTVGTDLVDEFGQTLDQPQTMSVVIKPNKTKSRRLRPQLSIHSPSSEPILDPSNPKLPILTKDVREFEVELRKVSLEDLESWRKWQADWINWRAYNRGGRENEKEPTPMPGELILRKVMRTRGLERLITEVDISPAMTHGVGHVLVSLREIRDPDKDYEFSPYGPTETHNWVQVTRLGITAVKMEDGVAVWVASTDDGQALPLAQVSLGSGAPLNTDSQGFVHLEPKRSRELMVRLGHDSAHLTLSYPRQSTPTFHFCEPQGVYRAGEMLRIRGFRNPNESIYADRTVHDYGLDYTDAGGTTERGDLGQFEFAIQLPKSLQSGHTYLRLSEGYNKDAAVLKIPINNYNAETGNLPKIPDSTPSWWYSYLPKNQPRPQAVIKAPPQVGSGQTLRLEIESPFRTGEGLFWTQNQQLQRFSVVNYKADIQLKVKEDDHPTLAMEVVIAGADDAGRGDYARGRSVAQMKTIGKEIKVDVRPKRDSAGTESEVEVALRDSFGQPVEGEVTVMMVDEKLRLLTGHQIKNPLETFYRPLHIRLVHNWNQRVAPICYTTEQLHGYTGPVVASAHREPLGEKLRDDFRTTPLFQTVKVGPSGRATIPFTLPDSLTRYRVSAVAVAEAGRYGLGESSLTVESPFSVEASIPSFLRIGDQLQFPVTVCNGTSKDRVVDITAAGDNLDIETTRRQITVPALDSREILFDAKATTGQKATLSIRARTLGYQDGVKHTIPILSKASDQLPTTRAAYGVIPSSGSIIELLACPASGADIDLSVSAHGLFEEVDSLRDMLLGGGWVRGRRSLFGLSELIRAMRLESRVSISEVEEELRKDVKRAFENPHYDNQSTRVSAILYGLAKSHQAKATKESIRAQTLPHLSSDISHAYRKLQLLDSLGVGLTATEEKELFQQTMIKAALYNPRWGPISEFPRPYTTYPIYQPEFILRGSVKEKRFQPTISDTEKKLGGYGAMAARIKASVPKQPIPLSVKIAGESVVDQEVEPTGWHQYRDHIERPTGASIENGSKAKLYYRMRLRARWPETDANPMKLKRTYHGAEQRGDVWQEGDTWHVRRGTTVEVTLKCSGKGKLTDRIPAGFEVVSAGPEGRQVPGLQLRDESISLKNRGYHTYTIRPLVAGRFSIPPAFIESEETPELWGQCRSQTVVVH